jgi:CRISPR type III-A/MTUBE-associated protein Csm6
MSSEVYEYHKHDNRYIYCLEKLGEFIGRKMEYELIIREELKDVHIFDYFIDEFRALLKDIYNQNKGDEIYFNVSSGTPAMKSALQILAAFREYNVIPIQVSTPEKRSNPHAEEKLNYQPEQMWECNEDNTNPANRCTISENIHFLTQIKKQMLSELINKYDYVGAKTLADTMTEVLSDRFVDLINAACMRIQMDYQRASNTFKKYGYKLLEHSQSNEAPVSEYLLLLNLKVQKGEYADFIRAITPIVADLFEMTLQAYCKFDINDYVYWDKNKVRRWDKNKLAKIPDILQRLNVEYGEFKNSPVYSDHILKLIEIKAPLSDLYKKCTELREIESKARNIVAHEIVSVNAEWVVKTVGISAEKIIDKIESVMNYTSIKTDKNYFNSYKRMNKILIDSLSEPV